MEKQLHLILALVFALCLNAGVSAQDTTEKPQKAKVQQKVRKKKKGQQKQKERLANRVKKNLLDTELTEDQEKKLAALIDEKFESLTELQKKINKFIDNDERKVVNAAVKKARDAGKAWPEAMKLAYEEIGLSEEDQKVVKGYNQQRNKILEGVGKEIVSTFSDEQKKSLNAARKAKRGKGKSGKGKGADRKKKQADG